MNTKETTVDELEDTKNNDAPDTGLDIDLTQMSREEVEAFALKNAKAYQDQKGLNEKLKSKVKEPEVLEKAKVETPTPDVTPEPAAPKVDSLEEQYEIANLSKTFSLEEIKEGRSFIGTSFGKNLSEVVANPGFLAHINSKRELSKSDSMMNDETLTIETYQSKEQFVADVESGNIDLTTNPKARQKYIDIKAKEEADRNFSK